MQVDRRGFAANPVFTMSNERSLKRTALRLGLVAGLVLSCLPQQSAVAQKMTVLTSSEASRSAFMTNKGIQWYNNLADAEGQAKKDGKLVLWIHMLGTMDGAT